MISRKALDILLFLLSGIGCYAQTLPDSNPIDTLLLDDGSLYMGQLSDSLFNGQGICIYADGTVYKGEWKDGLWEGEGILSYPDGDIYKGSFHGHMKEGRGTYIYSSGARYDGEWKDDRFNGQGRLLFEDGGVYDGAWKEDMKHGYGKLVNPLGRSQTGYFYYDEYLGQPFDTFIDADSTLTDELKEWGFKSEPQEIATEVSIGLSVSTKSFYTLTIWFNYAQHFCIGTSLGINADPPVQGKYTSYPWLAYGDDVYFEGKYRPSIFTLDAGYRWSEFTVGGAAGIGFERAYQNCKANGSQGLYTGYDISQGELYHKTTPTNAAFVYRAYFLYQIYVKTKPKACIYLGYGNPEALFLGAAFYL